MLSVVINDNAGEIGARCARADEAATQETIRLLAVQAIAKIKIAKNVLAAAALTNTRIHIARTATHVQKVHLTPRCIFSGAISGLR